MDHNNYNNIKTGSAIIGINRGRVAKIDYEVYGDDSAKYKLLFVMGFLQSGSAWKLQRDYFIKNKDFQICLYDNRGINNSTSFSLSTREMAQDAVDLLDHLKWNNNINLCGASLGGTIVTHICNLIPDRINSAIISAPHISMLSPFISEGQKQYFKALFIKEEKEKHQLLFKILFSDDHLNSPSMSDSSKTKGEAMVDRAIKNKYNIQTPSTTTLLSHLYVYLSTRFTRKDFNLINNNNVNIMVFGGLKDLLIPIENTKKDFVYNINSKEFKLFNTGHCINLEKPNEFNQSVLNYIINNNNNNKHNNKINSSIYNNNNNNNQINKISLFNLNKIKRYFKYK